MKKSLSDTRRGGGGGRKRKKKNHIFDRQVPTMDSFSN